jgi:hypothetical protein
MSRGTTSVGAFLCSFILVKYDYIKTMSKIKLELQRPVAFFPQLARALGGIGEAIFIQQLYYWSDKGKRDDGYVYKSKKEWEEETTLTRFQQDRIRKKMEEQGVIKTKLIKANGFPTIHYKLIEEGMQNLLMEKRETYLSNSEKLTKPLTESTTESTTTLSSKAGEVFSYKKEIEKLQTSPRKDYKIIADYLLLKGFHFENKEQYNAHFVRCLGSAKHLKGYNQVQIDRIIDHCKKNYPEWTMETLVKRSADVINRL